MRDGGRKEEREGGREEGMNGGKEGSEGCWKEERKKGGMMKGSVEVSMHCYTKNQYNFKQGRYQDTSLHAILPSSCISSPKLDYSSGLHGTTHTPLLC